ncbi:ECF transporter S component [Streptococcus dysgalactiae]|uniref:ECF transporter S component n=1 Tax=Streptococcus dysgalactiae TaxID=1334 RepID=A0AAE9UKJ7_STRDY|nr:ECF transporter S component [Streptococcus dysgalactiae]QGH03135.1 ABC transporter permease [Streptococcus dysgalactiae subsp. dysgalactiae]WAI92325.1 ECF transporter S component [Streptococcus dysgalactiae]
MSKFSLKDVLFISLLAVVLGVIYLGAGYVSSLFVPLVGPIAHEIIYGIWFVAAPMAIYILRKPGTAIIAEFLAALVEVLVGSIYGPSVLIIGALQGLGSELGFTIFKYKRYDWVTFTLSAVLTSVLSYIWSFYSHGLGAYSLSYNILNLTVRTLSSVVFFVLTKGICDKLHKAGVLHSYRINQEG